MIFLKTLTCNQVFYTVYLQVSQPQLQRVCVCLSDCLQVCWSQGTATSCLSLRPRHALSSAINTLPLILASWLVLLCFSLMICSIYCPAALDHQL